MPKDIGEEASRVRKVMEFLEKEYGLRRTLEKVDERLKEVAIQVGNSRQTFEAAEEALNSKSKVPGSRAYYMRQQQAAVASANDAVRKRLDQLKVQYKINEKGLITIVPSDAKTPLNRFAKALKDKHGIVLEYDPRALYEGHASAFFQQGSGSANDAILIDELSLVTGRPSVSMGHEIKHYFRTKVRRQGGGEPWSGLHQREGNGNLVRGIKNRTYNKYLWREEMITHDYDAQVLWTRLANPRTSPQVARSTRAALLSKMEIFRDNARTDRILMERAYQRARSGDGMYFITTPDIAHPNMVSVTIKSVKSTIEVPPAIYKSLKKLDTQFDQVIDPLIKVEKQLKFDYVRGIPGVPNPSPALIARREQLKQTLMTLRKEMADLMVGVLKTETKKMETIESLAKKARESLEAGDETGARQTWNKISTIVGEGVQPGSPPPKRR